MLLYVQWKGVDSSQLMDSKLKCVFEMPVDGAMVCIQSLLIVSYVTGDN